MTIPVGLALVIAMILQQQAADQGNEQGYETLGAKTRTKRGGCAQNPSSAHSCRSTKYSCMNELFGSSIRARTCYAVGRAVNRPGGVIAATMTGSVGPGQTTETPTMSCAQATCRFAIAVGCKEKARITVRAFSLFNHP